MSMELSVQGKNAIVTGAAGNIGEACVRALAEAGANVLVADMDAAAAERTVEKLQKEYPDVKLVPQVCDVTNKASVDAMVAAALEAFGRIDILNNIAGMSTKVDFLEMPEDIYDQRQGYVPGGPGGFEGHDPQPFRQDRQHVLHVRQRGIPHQCGVFCL